METFHQDGVGVPDELDRLWTPHRMAYISGENKPADATAGECPFCRIPSLADEEGLTVHRGAVAFAVLNLYPYSPGHLMVCPYRHVADYRDLTPDETVEVAQLTQRAMTVMTAVARQAADGPVFTRERTTSVTWATASSIGTPLRCEPSR